MPNYNHILSSWSYRLTVRLNALAPQTLNHFKPMKLLTETGLHTE